MIGGCTKLVFEQVFTQHFLKGGEGKMVLRGLQRLFNYTDDNAH